MPIFLFTMLLAVVAMMFVHGRQWCRIDPDGTINGKAFHIQTSIMTDPAKLAGYLTADTDVEVSYNTADTVVVAPFAGINFILNPTTAVHQGRVKVRAQYHTVPTDPDTGAAFPTMIEIWDSSGPSGNYDADTGHSNAWTGTADIIPA